MKIYEDLLDENEEILWIKEFPPQNKIPDQKEVAEIYKRASREDLLMIIFGFSIVYLFVIIIIVLNPLEFIYFLFLYFFIVLICNLLAILVYLYDAIKDYKRKLAKRIRNISRIFKVLHRRGSPKSL